MSESYALDAKRFDPWLIQFDRAVTAALGGDDPPPDDPPAHAALAAA